MAESRIQYNNPPREFLDNHAVHAMSSSTHDDLAFDPLEDKYRKKKEIQKGNMYAQAEREKANLLATMKNFHESVGKHKQIHIDTSKYQTWEEVEAIMNKVADEADRKSGKRAAVRRFFDRLGDNGSTFSAWLGLLPNGEYSSIACGAVKLIIQAAIGVRSVREIIFDALGSIPATLQNAKLYVEMWRSLKLHVEFSKLYTAILKVYCHVLLWLKENSLKSAAKAFFQQDGYEKTLVSKLDNVERCAASVREEASICSQYALGSINRNMERQTIQLNGMKVTFEGMKDGMGKLSDSMEDVKISQLRTEKSQVRQENLLNSLYSLLWDNYRERKAGLYIEEGHESKSETSDSGKAPVISQKNLRRILGHDRKKAERDIQKALTLGRAFNLALQERSEYLMASPEFKSWFMARDSRVLLVNGSAEHDMLSPMSFACGLLADSLQRCPGPIAISFFCGIQSTDRKGSTGGSHMLSDLICQLLERYQNYDLSSLTPEQQPALEDHDIDMLAALFVALVRQSPAGQLIFCIIDGISFFEYGDKRDDTVKAVESIASLVDDDEVHGILKVLITSPSISRASTKCLAPENIFSLPDVIEHSNQGFDGTRFERTAKAQVEELQEEAYEDVRPMTRWDVSSTEDDSESG